jgi:hypothetical protein
MQPLPQRVVAEALGTAMLLAAVVGSGIMGERLAAGNEAVALLANTIATGAAPGRVDIDVWSNIRRPHKSRGDVCERIAATHSVA